MTRLRQIAMAGLAAIAIGGVASSASAMETGTFQNRLNGATIGLPLGAAPPPGLYTGLETAYLGMIGNNSGHSIGNQCAAVTGGGCAALPALAQAVPLLWVPGFNWLNWFGGTYSASVVEAFYVFNARNQPGSGGNCTGAGPVGFGGFVYTNTYFQPIALSWKLGGDGSCPPASPSRRRPAPTSKARRTQAIGRSSRLLPSRIWAIIGSRRLTSSMISTPDPRANAALVVLSVQRDWNKLQAATRCTATSPLSIRSESGRSARSAILKCRRRAILGVAAIPRLA